MKTFKSLLLIAALGAACLAPAAKAQVTPPVTITVTNASGGTTTISSSPGNFLTTLSEWATSRSASGLTWGTNDLDIATGGRFVNNLQWANYITATKNFGSFYVGAEMDNAGIAGVVQQVSGRAGCTMSNTGDLRLKAGLNAGYNLQTESFVVQPEIGGEKLLTLNTFAELWVGYPVSTKGPQARLPDVRFGVGATF